MSIETTALASMVHAASVQCSVCGFDHDGLCPNSLNAPHEGELLQDRDRVIALLAAELLASRADVERLRGMPDVARLDLGDAKLSAAEDCGDYERRLAEVEAERDRLHRERETLYLQLWAILGPHGGAEHGIVGMVQLVVERASALEAERDRLAKVLAAWLDSVAHTATVPRIDTVNAHIVGNAVRACGGFGALMSEAARQWAERDMDGSFVVGPCRKTLVNRLAETRAALKAAEVGNE